MIVWLGGCLLIVFFYGNIKVIFFWKERGVMDKFFEDFGLVLVYL